MPEAELRYAPGVHSLPRVFSQDGAPMSASDPAVAPLEYEERQPLYRRRGPRQAFGLIISAILLPFGWYYVPSLKDLTVASWHRQCASYRAPPGQVIYDDDPATYAQLLGSANYVGNVLRQDRPYAMRDNPEWQGLSKARYGSRVAPVAYVGSRTSPGGNRRLVGVQFGTLSDPTWNRFMFIPYVETTNATGLRTTSLGAANGPQLELFRHSGDDLRVLDGQSDPNDPSRFTIDVQINGTTHTIDGQLHDNDTVTLMPRASTYVKYMGSVYWNPTGARMLDLLSNGPGATTLPASPSSASN
jgi:hypothetical protein